MADVYVIKGGPCIPLCLPFCGTTPADRASRLPYPRRVAGEFDRGRFTLSNVLDLLNNELYRKAIEDANLQVNDFISMILIPELHTFQEIYVDVDPDNRVVAPVVWTPKQNAAGVTFDVAARLFDKNGAQQSTVTLPAGFTGISAATRSASRAAINTGQGSFVPLDRWLEIGLVVKTLPTDTTVKMQDITSRIALVAKVDDYQYPFHL